MNPIVPLTILYLLMTIGSAGILYFSFKEKPDTSGKYFLLAETLTIFALTQVLVTNIYPELINSATLFFGVFIHIAFESAIFFSLYTLNRSIQPVKYWMVVLFAAVYAWFVELCRNFDPKLPVLLVGISSALIAIATYYAANPSSNSDLRENLFLKWIRFIEIGLLCFSILRVASYFSDTPIVPRQASVSVAILYTLYVALCIFRYISYQSLRISWIDPRHVGANPLNKNMVRLVKEKNNFLQGLISSNRAIGISALANSLAHQLSQPITGVIFQAESVKRDLTKQGGQQKSIATLGTVTEQLGNLSELINNLRRLFSAREPDFRPIFVQELCDEVLEIIEPTLKAEKIQLERLYETNPTVLGNSIQIQQVLINLFNNSIDSILINNIPIRRITIRISQEETTALLSVHDSGAGIDHELQPNIFELYKTTKRDGLGIGLWLSKEIIENHYGSIHASNSFQGGAIFEIRIPLYVGKNDQ